jgi:hypothetical protein
MVSAGERARLFDLSEDSADDGAQCVLYDLVVRDQALGGLVAHNVRW